MEGRVGSAVVSQPLLLLAQQPAIPSGACSVHCATVPHLTVLILTDTGRRSYFRAEENLAAVRTPCACLLVDRVLLLVECEPKVELLSIHVA